MPHFTQAYKYEEIQEYFNDYLKDNLDYLKENYPTTYLDDLHHYAFNEDYYIIGTYKAKQWLGEQAFDIINIIKNYEQDNFGEVTTDFSSSENVVNMYVFIIGEEIIEDAIEEVKESILIK